MRVTWVIYTPNMRVTWVIHNPYMRVTCVIQAFIYDDYMGNPYTPMMVRCVIHIYSTAIPVEHPIDPGCTPQITPGFPVLQPGLSPG